MQGPFYAPPITGTVTNVFALPEGLLIEVNLEPWADMTELRKIVNNEYVQPPVTASYFTLSFHPLADFRPLFIGLTEPFINTSEWVIFASKRIPLVVTFNPISSETTVYYLEYNFEEILSSSRSINFEGLIHLIDPSDSQLQAKALTGRPFVMLRPIFSQVVSTSRPPCIKLVESPANKYSLSEKKFYLHVLVPHAESHSLLVVEARLNLVKTGQHLAAKWGCAVVGELCDIDSIHTASFFELPDNLFKVKDHFAKCEEQFLSFSHIPALAPRPSNDEEAFFRVSKTSLQRLMSTQLPKNAIICQRKGKIVVVHGAEIVYEMSLDVLCSTPSEILKVRNGRVTLRVEEKKEVFSLPRFRTAVFSVLVSLLLCECDPRFAAQLLRDLSAYLIKFRIASQNSNLLKLTDVEIIAMYFASLLTAGEEGCHLNLLVPDLEHKRKKVNLSGGDNFQLMKALAKGAHYDAFTEIVSSSLGAKSYFLPRDSETLLKTVLPSPTLNLLQHKQNLIDLFALLHAAHEEYRIVKKEHNTFTELGTVLFVFAQLSGHPQLQTCAQNYLSINPSICHYIQKSSLLRSLIEFPHKPRLTEQIAEPFDILRLIQGLLAQGRESKSVALPPKVAFLHSYHILKLVTLITTTHWRRQKTAPLNSIIAAEESHCVLPVLPCFRAEMAKSLSAATPHTRDQPHFVEQSLQLFDRIFHFFVKSRITAAYVESHADCVSYIYKSVLRIIRQEIRLFLKNPHVPKRVYALLSREDIYRNQRMSPTGIDVPGRTLLSLNNIGREGLKSAEEGNESRHVRSERSSPRLALLELPPELEENTSRGAKARKRAAIKSPHARNTHFSKEDALFKELYRTYECSEPVILSHKHTANIFREENNDEHVQQELNSLMDKLLHERFSAFVARGAADFSTENTTLTEVVPIPDVILKCYAKENFMLVNYVHNPESPEDRSFMNWADFHNGVSAALKVSRRALESLDKESIRTWIDYQRTETSRYDHAGLLFGLGLQGLFECFTTGDIYSNFKTCNDARIIGTIFGLAIPRVFAKRVETEETILKAFNLHLEFNYLTPEFRISRIIQSAALVAIGIYHQSLSKKSFTETMLVQIAAAPINENNADRECYSLCAGFALGLLNLGKGSRIPSIRDVNLDERLFRYIEGGVVDDKPQPRVWSTSPLFPLQSKGDFQASNVLESRQPAAAVIVPSALVALMLTHLKTNNKIISSRICIPATIFEINRANPFHVFLKVVAFNLIEWEAMVCSAEFVHNAVPHIIRFINENEYAQIHDKFQTNPNFAQLDYQIATMLYHYTTAGSLFALCLKFAGTADAELKALVIAHLQAFRKVPISDNVFAFDRGCKGQLDSYTYYQLLSILCLALSVLMAGYCDVECFNLISAIKMKLRAGKRIGGDYGFNMAFELAIGFLFLGNGSFTFGNGDFQVACLLMAVYPTFPSAINDNQHHLQTLRHLYVLAAEENLFNLVDVDTNQPVQLTVQIESINRKGEMQVESKVSPVFLRSTNVWTRIRVLDENFHRLNFSVDQTQQYKPSHLYVKKKFLFDTDVRKLKHCFEEAARGTFALRDPFKSSCIQTLVELGSKSLPADKLMKFIACLYHVFKNDKNCMLHLILDTFWPQPMFTDSPPQSVSTQIVINFIRFLRVKSPKLQVSSYIEGAWNEADAADSLIRELRLLLNERPSDGKELFIEYGQVSIAALLARFSRQQIQFGKFRSLLQYLYQKRLDSLAVLVICRKIMSSPKLVQKFDLLNLKCAQMGIELDEGLWNLLKYVFSHSK